MNKTKTKTKITTKSSPLPDKNIYTDNAWTESNMKNRYIVIVGNFGSGHEIIVRFLQRHFKRLRIIEKMNYPGIDFLSQMSSLSKIFKIMKSNKRFYRNQIFICDNHPIFIQNCILPALHSMGKLESKEVIVFREWVRLIGMETEPAMIIYLKSNTNKCFERVLNGKVFSERTEDSIVDFEYLLEIQRQLTHWFENENNIKNETDPDFLTIDMNKYLEIDFDERLEKDLLRYVLREFPFLESVRTT